MHSPCCLQVTLQKKLPPSSGKSTPILPSSCMMIRLHTCCAPTIGSSPSIRNCCTPHRDTMPPSQVNERGCSGLARVTAHPRPVKTKRQTPNTTQVSDWIGGKCYADTLQVWFPAHWVPHVIQQLQKKEHDYRQAHPSWFDQPEVPEELQKSWREA